MVNEFLLRFSSKNRQKSGTSRSHDFTTKFNDPIRLPYDAKHEIAVRTISMTYSWYNIRQSYNNHQFKFSKDKGVNWETITFVDGMYSYDDINDYIHKYLENKKYSPIKKDGRELEGDDAYGINLYFVLSTYRVLIELNENYRVDLRNTDFRKLIGFDSKIITGEEYGSLLPNITRGVDEVHINCDKVTASLVDGQSTSTIAVIPVENLVRSLPFTYKPRFLAYSPLSSHLIPSMRFYVTDSSGTPIILNGIDWYIEVFVRSTEFTG